MRTKIIGLALTLLIPVVGISWLAVNSTSSTFRKNEFQRSFIGATNPERVYYFNERLMNIAGVTSSGNLYISTFIPGQVISIDPNGKVKREGHPLESFGNPYTTFVDSPYCYIFSGNMGAMYKGRLGQATLNRIQVAGPIFSRALYIDSNTFLLRQFKDRTKNQEFIKTDLKGYIQKGIPMTTDDNDGGVSTDGMLLYAPAMNRFVYTYYYRNEFLIIDTGLKHFLKGISVAHLKTSADTSVKQRPNTEVIINRASCIVAKKLLIASGIRADNETQLFSKNVNVDVYDLKRLTYEGSFYIPKIKDEEPFALRFYNERLICLYPHALALCLIPERVTR